MFAEIKAMFDKLINPWTSLVSIAIGAILFFVSLEVGNRLLWNSIAILFLGFGLGLLFGLKSIWE